LVHLQIQLAQIMRTQPNILAATDDFEFAALAEAKNYRAALLRDFREQLHGNVLEVGAGIGQITSELLALPGVDKVISIEPDPTFCAKLKARLPAHEFVEGTIADLASDLHWNAILSINVLEHIEHDSEELAAYHRLLRPTNGALCLFVPARPEIYAPIDRDFGHFRRYERNELVKKLAAAGFSVRRIRYYNLVGYFLWLANFRLLKKKGFTAGAVRLFDQVAFPLIHGFESHVCAPPIGQSLQVVAFAQ
jgi:SAM-dependent methyltransferase